MYGVHRILFSFVLTPDEKKSGEKNEIGPKREIRITYPRCYKLGEREREIYGRAWA